MDDFDHRSLGARLDLFHLEEDAPGMVFWHPRGYALYRVLEDYIRRHMRRLGYFEVRTPQLMPRSLWERSGHWQKFGQSMFSMTEAEERSMALKPMSCPCHVALFNKGQRSWRDLPLRYAEFGACHRNEASGALLGLLRTRSFEQDDAHVFCRPEDVAVEVSRFANLLSEVYSELGFSDYTVALSTRPAVRAGSEELWDWAEATLAEAADQCGLVYEIQPGEGAFYGPKLEFALRDWQQRSWQCGTIQLDCVLPERLGAAYVGPDGTEEAPLMIHHAVFGSLGRAIALLLERYGGALPFWLAPEQVAVTPVSRDVASYAGEVVDCLDQAGLRPVLYDRRATLARRIVAAHEAQVPVVAVLGRREAETRSVTLRERDGSQSTLPLSQLGQTLAARRS
ncbi:threonine--tRNA ligase [Pelagibius sp. 7325]|uniref:threonine--tRNA ligase n=1 Tax=Pelagibius sp. 7325 TaxID=3131994 RepID=UPI0030EE3749